MMGITDGQGLEAIWVAYWHLGAKRFRAWAGFNVPALLAALVGAARAYLGSNWRFSGFAR